MVGSPSVSKIMLGRRVTSASSVTLPSASVTGTSTIFSPAFSKIRADSRIPHWVGVEPTTGMLLAAGLVAPSPAAVAFTLTESPDEARVKKFPLSFGA